LRTVATAWQQQRLTENAEEIQAMGRELYERLTTMADHVAQVGTALKRAGSAYDDFVGSLDARVLVSARRFRELGVSAPRELPEIVPPVQLEIREPRAAELRVPTQESLLIEAEIVPPSPEEPSAGFGATPSLVRSNASSGATSG
jgi:DNA anti-recombination protein RmuC